MTPIVVTSKVESAKQSPTPACRLFLRCVRANEMEVVRDLSSETDHGVSLLRLLPIWKICANRRENVFAQLDAVGITERPRPVERFFGHGNCTRKISGLGISRGQRIEKCRNFALSQVAG